MICIAARSGTPSSKLDGCRSVAGVMQPRVSDAGGFKELFPVREVSSVVDGLAYLVREEPTLFVPQLSGFLPFLALLDEVQF